MATKVLIKGSDFMAKLKVDAIEGRTVTDVNVKLYTDGAKSITCALTTSTGKATGVQKSGDVYYIWADADSMKTLADGYIKYEAEIAVTDTRFPDSTFNRIFQGKFDVNLQTGI